MRTAPSRWRGTFAQSKPEGHSAPGAGKQGPQLGTEWDPSLALGHAEIDGQHQELFRRYAALVKAMANGANDDLAVLFDFLGEYVVEHFAAEEILMAQVAYPGATVHAAAHARFVREFGELRALWLANGPTHGVYVKTSTWIGDWLQAHISCVDVALARYLRDTRAPAEMRTQEVRRLG